MQLGRSLSLALVALRPRHPVMRRCHPQMDDIGTRARVRVPEQNCITMLLLGEDVFAKE